MLTETREDLLQGIKAMDDSIQTLKAEMNKLLSVYECVRLQPEERAVTETGRKRFRWRAHSLTEHSARRNTEHPLGENTQHSALCWRNFLALR